MICHQPMVPNLGNGLHQMTPMEINHFRSNAEHDIIQHIIYNHGFKGGRARQRRPQTNHRGARHHSKSCPKPWIQRRAVEATTQRTEHREARNHSKTMDSTVGGQGNDVPEPSTAGRENIQIPIQHHGFKGARPRQRRPEPSTAEHEILQNPI